MSCRDGSIVPVILTAVFTMRCRVFLLQSVQLPPHTVMQLERMLCNSPSGEHGQDGRWSTGVGSGGAIRPSMPVMWRWWSMKGPH